MNELASWHVNNGLTARLIKALAHKTNERVILRLGEKSLTDDENNRLRKIDRTVLDWTTPLLVWASTSSHAFDSPSLLISELEAIASREDPPPTTVSSGDSQWSRAGVDAVAADLAAGGIASDVAYVSRPPDDIVATTNRALDCLARGWTEGYTELQSMVREVVFVSGAGFRNASVPSTLGAVYLSSELLDDVPTGIDMLTHEAAHHALTLRTLVEPYLENPSDEGRSPLRPDPRGLLGILHATFVLIRVGDALVSCAPTLPIEERNGIRARVEVCVSEAREGFEVLSQSAVWTELGLEFAASLQEGIETLADSVPA